MKVTLLTTVLALLCVYLPAHAVENKPPVVPVVISQAHKGEKINLNKATAKNLVHSIKGIGIKRAEAIIKYREAHNGFKNINELGQVPGFGKTFVSKHLEEMSKIYTIS